MKDVDSRKHYPQRDIRPPICQVLQRQRQVSHGQWNQPEESHKQERFLTYLHLPGRYLPNNARFKGIRTRIVGFLLCDGWTLGHGPFPCV